MTSDWRWLVGSWEGYVISIPPEVFDPTFVHFMADGTWRQEVHLGTAGQGLAGAKPFVFDGGILELDMGRWTNTLEIERESANAFRLKNRWGTRSRWERLTRPTRRAIAFVDPEGAVRLNPDCIPRPRICTTDVKRGTFTCSKQS